MSILLAKLKTHVSRNLRGFSHSNKTTIYCLCTSPQGSTNPMDTITIICLCLLNLDVPSDDSLLFLYTHNMLKILSQMFFSIWHPKCGSACLFYKTIKPKICLFSSIQHNVYWFPRYIHMQPLQTPLKTQIDPTL